ncbi:L-2-hydroxyglutarate oxidase LhgO [Peribacillus sp. B2I2]
MKRLDVKGGKFMLEWIIIGGGIQGTTMAAFLLKSYPRP